MRILAEVQNKFSVDLVIVFVHVIFNMHSKRKSEAISKPLQPKVREPATEVPQDEMNDIMSQYLPQPEQGEHHDKTVVIGWFN